MGEFNPERDQKYRILFGLVLIVIMMFFVAWGVSARDNAVSLCSEACKPDGSRILTRDDKRLAPFPWDCMCIAQDGTTRIVEVPR